MHRKYSTSDFKITALPTAGLFKWFMVAKNEKNGETRLKYCKYNFLTSYKPRFRYSIYFALKNAQPPVDSKEKAMSYSYNLKEVRSFIRRFKYPLAEVERNEAGSHWTVFWFPLELMGLNRAMAIRVDLNIDGNYRTKRSFFKKFSDI